MRVTIVVDSATPAEVYGLTLAFQRTCKDRPVSLTKEPTVQAQGVAMTWSSPPLHPDSVARFWAEYATEHRTEPNG